MLGALSGAVGAANGPQSGSESRISSSILPLNSVAIAGLTLVVDPRESGCRLHRCLELSANIVLTDPHAEEVTTSECVFWQPHSVIPGISRLRRPGLGAHRDARQPTEITTG